MPAPSPSRIAPIQPPLSAAEQRRSYQLWAGAVAALAAAFALPLYSLVRFSLHDETHSHVIIIPLVCAYFVWIKRKELPAPRRSWLAAGLPLIAGLGFLAAYLLASPTLPTPNRLALSTTAFVLMVVAATLGILGPRFARSVAFSLGFLIFMIPMPVQFTEWMEHVLQYRSADAAHAMFQLAGTPEYRDELVIRLPGINLQIAPECSGIRSTLALFITSVAAGQLFLRSVWLRAILAGCVLPLAILRNGFRVFTIGELCVHINPNMIDSFIHHRGGPIFFALSLIPFGIILKLLIRFDSRKSDTDSLHAPHTNPSKS